ncbi:hypothetical protein ACFL1N_12195 [Thermodesulfobacteriota bacterium]
MEKIIQPDHSDTTGNKSDILCAFCQSGILPTDTHIFHCPDCNALYHADCWQENRGCAVYGCPQTPDTEQYKSVEIPVSYWGQEDKQCPDCGKVIRAAAVRCRYCGTVFPSANPMDVKTYTRINENNRRFPQMRKSVIWLLVFCMTPLSAPFAAIIGLIWYRARRTDVVAMPAPYPGICKFGIFAAAGQTIIMILMLMLYNFFN